MLNLTDKQLEEINEIKNLENYKDTNILPVILPNILALKNQGFNLKHILQFTNKECNISLQYYSFYRWIVRNKKKELKKVKIKEEPKTVEKVEEVVVPQKQKAEKLIISSALLDEEEDLKGGLKEVDLSLFKREL